MSTLAKDSYDALRFWLGHAHVLGGHPHPTMADLLRMPEEG